MTIRSITRNRTLLALVAACAMAALFAQPATAQSGGKLNCKGCVKSKQIRNNGIKGKDIQAGAVSNEKIAPDAVSSDKIANETVGATDLANEPGVDFDFEADLVLAQADQTVLSVDVTAPSTGFVTVIAAGTFVRSIDDGDARGRCSLTTGNTIDSENDVNGDVTVENAFIPFSIVETFTQSGDTTVTYNLVCDASIGTGIELDDADMVAMFFPTQY